MSKYKICNRCVLDSTAKNIKFDDEGNCSYCTEFMSRSVHIVNKDKNVRERERDSFIEQIKAKGKNCQYDCIVGVSGGVDSSWALVQAKLLGLRPLAVHMDNGWNSELAQNNIENLVTRLNVDLYTHVIDWNEYKQLMQTFFDADVIDVELLYDNAMLAVNYNLAAKHGVKYILSGGNQATEGVRTPQGWNWFKRDKKNIKRIASKFGTVKLKTFPAFGTLDYINHEFVKGIKWVPFLDYFEFNKFETLKVLEQEYGYKPYPYKHYESVFTRFYQGYILPEKFNVDKRKLHLSALVLSGQMSREEALEELKGIPYASEQALSDDKEYFLKKMGWKSDALERYLSRPERPHIEYGSEKPLWDFCHKVYKKITKR